MMCSGIFPTTDYNLYFTLKGAGGTIEVPNQYNPCSAKNIKDVITKLANNMPDFNFGIEVVGIRIERV